ncbi:hypothetical protein RE9416_34560 [Prescottella equi]|nr:hypothetical protein RE9416_34560 [Prescottella equi]
MGSADACCGVLDRTPIEVGEGDVRSTGGEGIRGGAADAASGTGHEHSCTLERDVGIPGHDDTSVDVR